jgi:hypothetical protein
MNIARAFSFFYLAAASKKGNCGWRFFEQRLVAKE